MHFFGIEWLGVDAGSLRKLGLSVAYLAAILILVYLVRGVSALLLRGRALEQVRLRFWTRQATSLLGAILLVLGLISIWFDNPARLATAFGLVTAGVAFALQQVITALAGYFVILRGNTFTVGDRITMGGVRGDVVWLNFLQTTIMEMGQPPRGDDGPSVWVKSRQFTGRIVTVSNSRIFTEPVYNYTRDFPFIWEEISIGVAYRDDRVRAEAILLEAARRHAIDPEDVPEQTRRVLSDRFRLESAEFAPRVFYRLTDNWLELTVRFVFNAHGVRSAKDQMNRFILDELEKAGIPIASTSTELGGLLPIELRRPKP